MNELIKDLKPPFTVKQKAFGTLIIDGNKNVIATVNSGKTAQQLIVNALNEYFKNHQEKDNGNKV